MMTGDDLDRFTARTLRELRGMSSAQRTDFVERILRSDPELRPVLPELLATCARVRYMRKLGPLLRDSVV